MNSLITTVRRQLIGPTDAECREEERQKREAFIRSFRLGTFSHTLAVALDEYAEALRAIRHARLGRWETERLENQVTARFHEIMNEM